MSKAKEYQEALRALGRKWLTGVPVMDLRDEIAHVEKLREGLTKEDLEIEGVPDFAVEGDES